MPFSVATRFRAIDRMSKVFKKVGRTGSRSMRKIRVSVAKVNRGVMGFVKNFGMAGKVGGALLAGFSFAAIQGQISDTINLGLKFEDTMVAAAGKFPGEIRKGTEEFNALKKAALDTGKTTEFTANEAAQGLNFLALAGFNASQAMAALPGTVNLATAAETDLASATDIATDSLGAFNLMTKDSVQLQKNLARVSDVMAKTSTTANTSLSALFESIRSGGPDVSAAGVQIEKFAAMSGILADAGKKGEKAGTILKNVFLRLQAPTTAGRKAFKKMGIEVADQNGNLKDFSVILDDLNKKLPKGVKRADALNKIFGKIGVTGVNILLNKGGQALRDYTKELENSVGFTKTLADVMRDTTGGSIKKMNSAIEALKIQMFEAFAPTLKVVVEGLTKFVGVIANVFEKLGPFGPLIIDVVAALTAAVAIIGLLAAAIVVVNAAIAIFNALFVANPIGLIILGIATLIFMIIQLVKHFGKIKKIALIVFKFLKENFLLLLGPIGILIRGIQLLGVGLKKLGIIGKNEIEVSKTLKVQGEGGDSEGENGINTPQAAEAESTVNTINRTSESVEKSQAEVVIRDETGRAEVTKQTGAPKSLKLDMPASWSF